MAGLKVFQKIFKGNGKLPVTRKGDIIPDKVNDDEEELTADDVQTLFESLGNDDNEEEYEKNESIDEEDTDNELSNFTYECAGNNVILLNYIGDEKDLEIKSSYKIQGQKYTTKINSLRGFFRNCLTVISIHFEDGIITPELDDMAFCFRGCKNLESITGLENISTNKVISMEGLFYMCESLYEVDLTSWRIPEVKNLNDFAVGSGLTKIKVDCSKWKIPNECSISDMFYDTKLKNFTYVK